jgi:hypothetical protein
MFLSDYRDLRQVAHLTCPSVASGRRLVDPGFVDDGFERCTLGQGAERPILPVPANHRHVRPSANTSNSKVIEIILHVHAVESLLYPRRIMYMVARPLR